MSGCDEVVSNTDDWGFIGLTKVFSSEAYFYRYIINDDPTIRTYSARFVITKKFKTQGVMAATTVSVVPAYLFLFGLS